MGKDIKGKLITFEGSEGSGKSTQIEMIRGYLKAKGKDVLFLREPGGVKISEKIRSILLDKANIKMCDECETLLYMAARAQLVREMIEPALKENKIVLCDRFLDSTLAYQGYGSGVDLPTIDAIGSFATEGIKPDLTVIFDIDADEGLARIKGSRDRIESRPADYHKRVRGGYLNIAGNNPDRVKVIRVDGDKESIHEIVKSYVDKVLD